LRARAITYLGEGASQPELLLVFHGSMLNPIDP
jgi:hypothetical protein